ncbi:MAG: ROK family transcriptional regulator [Bacillota bacterium]
MLRYPMEERQGAMNPGPRTGNPAMAREMNRSLVVDALLRAQPLSRTDLARATGLSQSTVSVIVEDLLKRGYVRETGLGASSGGRKPVLLELAPDAAVAAGLEITPHQLIGVVTDVFGRIRHRQVAPVRSSGGMVPIQPILSFLDELLTAPDVTRERLVGLGVATPGVVDPETGTVRHSPNLGWRELPLGSLLQEHTGLRTLVERDVKAAAWGEHSRGAARWVDNVVYLKVVARGIGAGVILNGRLYAGTNRHAGELGHIVVDRSGPLCECGNRGCIGKFLSNEAFLDRAAALFSDPQIGFDGVLQALSWGDSRARRLAREFGEYLGFATDLLINTFDPEMVVVGGELIALGEAFLGPARELAQRSRLVPEVRFQLVPALLGENAGVLGAATLVLESQKEYVIQTRPWI